MDYRQPPYGNLVELNTCRELLEAIGEGTLADIANDYLDVLGSAAAIYEKNGDYALSLFSSPWCRCLNQASRTLCQTDDNAEALRSGRWHCHESCWNDASRVSIETSRPVDVPCRGGLRLYAVPILAGDEVVGSMNFGYGDPPAGRAQLQEIAGRYGVDVDTLETLAHTTSAGSQTTILKDANAIELAGRQLRVAARLLGEIVERKRTEKALRESEVRLRSDISERKQAEEQRARWLAGERTARARAERAVARLEAIQQVTDEALSHLGAEELMHQMLERVRRILHSDTAAVLLIDSAGRQLHVSAYLGFKDDDSHLDVPVGRGVAGRIAATRVPMVVDEMGQVEVFSEQLRQRVRSLAGVPMLHEDRVIGVLHVGSFEPRRYTGEDVQLLQLAADRVALALENARLYKQARLEEAERLANAYNRSLIEASLDPLVTIDPAGRITDVNEATVACTGRTREELIGTDFADYFTEPARARAGYRQAYHDGIVRDYPLEIMHRQGKITPVLYNAAVYREVSGKVAGLFAAARDITALRRAEQIAQQHSKKLQILHDIDHAALSAQAAGEIAQVALQHIRQVIACDRASVAAFDASAREAVFLAVEASGQETLHTGDRIPFDDFGGPAEHWEGKAHWLPDVAAIDEPSPVVRALQSDGIRAHMSVPLSARGEVIGRLYLGARQPGVFTSEDLDFAQQVADSLAVAIQNAQLFEAVLDGRTRLQALSRRLIEVQESERRYIARELHDDASQALAALMVSLGLLERDVECPPAIKTRLHELKESADAVLENLHALAADLRPASLDHVGVVPAIEQYVTSLRKRTGLSVQFVSVGMEGRRLPREIEITLYRVVQESLANVLRHARAGSAGVLLEYRDGRVVAIIEDDGAGFDPQEAMRRGRLGLFGMRERAEMLGGSLTVESAPGTGTTVYAELPCSC